MQDLSEYDQHTFKHNGHFYEFLVYDDTVCIMNGLGRYHIDEIDHDEFKENFNDEDLTQVSPEVVANPLEHLRGAVGEAVFGGDAGMLYDTDGEYAWRLAERHLSLMGAMEKQVKNP